MNIHDIQSLPFIPSIHHWLQRLDRGVLVKHCSVEPKDGSLSPRIANNLLPYLWILDNLFGGKNSQPGVGALTPHFGRYVPRQRKKWGAPERARAWNCRAPERAREWNCRAPERVWAWKWGCLWNWLCRMRLAGANPGALPEHFAFGLAAVSQLWDEWLECKKKKIENDSLALLVLYSSQVYRSHFVFLNLVKPGHRKLTWVDLSQWKIFRKI